MAKDDDTKKKPRDLSSVISKVQGALKKDEKRKNAISLGTELRSKLVGADPEECVVMPTWFSDHFEMPGLEFGRVYQIAGNSDTGKTSLAITAMKQAIEQGTDVIYVETENKTTEDDLIAWGVDPARIMLIKETVTEIAWDSAFRVWDEYFKQFPDGRLLFVMDSYGNTVSMRSADMDLVEQSAQPGETAKINRLAMGKATAKFKDDKVAMFIVNYNYANMGSHGNTEAGGKALYFYSSVIIESSRVGFVEKTVAGEKVRVGAKCRYRLKKNHANKNHKKDLFVQIDANGITPLDGGNDE